MAGWFDKFYGATQEVVDKMKAPLVRRDAKRRFKSAYDDAETKKIDAEAKLETLRSEVKNININEILKQKKYINECVLLKALIVEEYKNAFDKEMKITEDED